uniref:Glutamate decarboxylase 1 n=1 Tax=Macrostomum lignano TaxID=282301 RepID=A0A1I8FFF5_9PLAT
APPKPPGRRRRRLQSAAAAPLKTSGRSPPVSAGRLSLGPGAARLPARHRRPRSRHGAPPCGAAWPPRHGDFLLAAAAAAGSAKEAEAMIKEATALEELPAETHSGGGLGRKYLLRLSGRGKKIGDGDGEEKRAEKGPGFEPDWSRFEGALARFHHGGGDLLLEYLHRINDRSNKVLDFHHPHQLREALSHCLEIPVEPRDLEQILSDCKETLKYAVKTGHPRFFNQLSSGLDVIAMAGEWLTAATNTNMFTYEIAPVFVLMEEVTLQKMRESTSAGRARRRHPGSWRQHLQPVRRYGGRYNRFPEVKMRGMRAVPELAMFTSKDAHYSVKKSAAILAMGMDSVYLVDTAKQGQDAARAPGAADRTRPQPRSGSPSSSAPPAAQPCWAPSTAGRRSRTCASGTGSGSTCDTAWGGGVLLSQRHRHLLAGVQRADSVTWNPHKLMGVTLQCSVILLPERHIGLLQGCNGMQADYLFQQDKQYDVSYDTGDKSIPVRPQERHLQALAVLEGQGDEGYVGVRLTTSIDLANYLCQQAEEASAGYEMVNGENRLCQRLLLVRAGEVPLDEAGTGEGTAPSTRWPPQSEGADDGEWHHNGGLPTPRQPAELLPHDRVEPGGDGADIDFLLDCIEKYSAEIFDDQPDEAGIGGGGGPA